MSITVPKGKTHEEQIAWRVQGFVIRFNVRGEKHGPMPRLPSVEQFTSDLKLLIERQHAETRLELLMQLASGAAAEQARGMLISKMAQEERREIDRCNRLLKSENEIEREGDDDNSTFYPPTGRE
jgi:hypothetical protein